MDGGDRRRWNAMRAAGSIHRDRTTQSSESSQMPNLSPFVEMALVLAATVTPIIVCIRLLAGWTDDVERIIRATPMAWPRGVQEEEPKPWRLGATAA
jgi:hypothetical protein